MRGALFEWPPRAQFLTKSIKFCAHQIEKFLEIILGIEILEKGYIQPELRTIKVIAITWYFLLHLYTYPSLFLAFTVFTSSVYFIWSVIMKDHVDISFLSTQTNGQHYKTHHGHLSCVRPLPAQHKMIIKYQPQSDIWLH